MVLPLVDEHKPKCYLCHKGFDNIEKLREHQRLMHADFAQESKNQSNQGPAPGDVTLF